jgi:hypothetical protein
MRRGELVVLTLLVVAAFALLTSFTLNVAYGRTFPKHPTRAIVAKLVPDWQGFVRLGRCEQPGYSKYHDGVQWGNQGPTYGGGVGLYRHTWEAARSPYRVFSGNKWETILVADAIRDTYGITAWGAWRCFS